MEDKILKNMMDNGWSKMESILDKELPNHKKKNRRYLIILFSILVFGFAYLFSDIYSVDSIKKENIKPQRSTSLMAKYADYDLKLPSQISKSLFINSKSNIQVLKSDATLNNFTKNENRNSSGMFDDLLSNKNDSTVHKNANDIFAAVTYEPHSELSYLEVITSKVDYTPKTPTINMPNLNSLPKKEKWNIGLIGNVTLNNFSSPYQYHAGIFVTKQLNKNIFVEGRSGVKWFTKYTHFLYNNRNGATSASISPEIADQNLENIFIEETKSLNSNEVNFINENIINNSLSSVKYLENSVLLKYQWSKSVFLGAGINYGLFLNATFNANEKGRSVYQAVNNASFDSTSLTNAGQLLKHTYLTYAINTEVMISTNWSVEAEFIYGKLAATQYPSKSDLEESFTTSGLNYNASLLKKPEAGNMLIGINAKYKFF